MAELVADAEREIGARVRELRIALAEDEGAPISQEALARRAGISLLTLHKVESGKVAPTVDTLRKIAGALGVPVGTLIEGR